MGSFAGTNHPMHILYTGSKMKVETLLDTPLNAGPWLKKYSLFLKLEGRTCIVIGNVFVAHLLSSGAWPSMTQAPAPHNSSVRQ